MLSEKRGTYIIILPVHFIIMYSSIQFNSQLGFMTVKIKYISIDCLLPPEFFCPSTGGFANTAKVFSPLPFLYGATAGHFQKLRLWHPYAGFLCIHQNYSYPKIKHLWNSLLKFTTLRLQSSQKIMPVHPISTWRGGEIMPKPDNCFKGVRHIRKFSFLLSYNCIPARKLYDWTRKNWKFKIPEYCSCAHQYVDILLTQLIDKRWSPYFFVQCP